MRVELTQLPAIDVGGRTVLPQRRTWDAYMSGAELDALGRAAEWLREHPERSGLDQEARRALLSAVELAQLVVQREEDGSG